MDRISRLGGSRIEELRMTGVSTTAVNAIVYIYIYTKCTRWVGVTNVYHLSTVDTGVSTQNIWT